MRAFRSKGQSVCHDRLIHYTIIAMKTFHSKCDIPQILTKNPNVHTSRIYRYMHCSCIHYMMSTILLYYWLKVLLIKVDNGYLHELWHANSFTMLNILLSTCDLTALLLLVKITYVTTCIEMSLFFLFVHHILTS